MNPARIVSRSALLAHGPIHWTEAGEPGAGPALVLLHGIGSGAGSWQAQLEHFGRSHRVLAWDAPGYGESAPLPIDQPFAVDYADALAAWLRAAAVQALVLVGHSLGAMVAAAWAARPAASRDETPPREVAPRWQAMVLASPARGYGQTEPSTREAKFRERVEAITRLGPRGLAAARAANLCAPGAPEAVIEQVRANMARVTPRGYGQAAHMLAFDDLASHLAGIDRSRGSLQLVCGALDGVTSPQACEALARQAALPITVLPALGHACYVEDPGAFNRCLEAAVPALCPPPERAA